MGVNIADIVPRKEIEFSDLKNKFIAVDAFNVIYQFLTTIRQRDGTPLQDSKGRVSSHISGLFYRNISLLQEGLKMLYVFDGVPPEMKREEAAKRKERKKEAKQKYEKAKDREDVEAMGKYARSLSELDEQKIEESKKLLKALGICVVQAPGEGEAQAAYLAKNYKEIYGVASQDYDSLLFQAPVIVQNLTLARKRRTVSGWTSVNPEKIELEKVLNSLQITQEQLICLGILTGTDYNPGGVRGLGPKKSLKIVRNYKYPAEIFKKVEEQNDLDFDWQKIFELFKKPNVVKDVDISCPKQDLDKVKEILLDYDFAENRIDSGMEKLQKAIDDRKQQTLF